MLFNQLKNRGVRLRENLKELIKNTIVFQFSLPCNKNCITSTCHTTLKDYCYQSINDENLVDIIYNAIIDYSFEEEFIEKEDLSVLHTKALMTKLRYDHNANETVQKKYGFYGEVLLHAILRAKFKTDVFISRGYFYSPLENSEAKGYDSYHMIQNANKLQLWFGEAKFYESYRTAIKSVMKSIEKAISDDYFNKNILAIVNYKDRINPTEKLISEVIESWESNPYINLADEVKKYNVELVYPVLITYEKLKSGYEASIASVVEYINTEFAQLDFNLSFPYKIFFMLLPIDEVGKIKLEVIECIKSKKQLV